jgi:DNA-binding MarR family transcriptional regulator
MTTSTFDEKMLAWRVLMELHASVVDALERHLHEGGGVPLAWYEVLLRLSHAPDASIRMQDLADVLLLSRSGVTRLADRLEAAGLIERRVCETDRRGTLAVITGAGRDAIERATPLVVEALDQHFARHLTKTDARALLPILEHVLDASRAARGDVAPLDVSTRSAAVAQGAER